MRSMRAVWLLLASLTPLTLGPTLIAAPTSDNTLGAALEQVARARSATARYHDVEQALADGYVNIGYASGEGFEFVNFSLADCIFDPEQPEVLHYVPSGDGLRLVGVEYAIPLACTTSAPEGFSGDEDEWESEAEGLPLWTLNAWLWLGNPNGIFAEAPHPRIP